MIQQLAISIILILGCALLGQAVWTDTRAHRIPNWLVLGLLLIGFAYQLLAHGPAGLLYALGGLVVGTGLFIGFYIGRGMGAGDVKLMGAAGALLGPAGALLAAACSLVAGVILVVAAVKLRVMRSRYAGPDILPDLLVEKDGATRVPYAPAIAAGCYLTIWQLGLFSMPAAIAQ